MGSYTLRLVSSALCGAMLLATGHAAETNTFDPSTADPAVMQKMMQEFAKLAPEHDLFKRMEGSWTAEVKSFSPNPAEPTVSKGSAEFKLLMGGRYLVQHFNGAFDGQEFEGVGISAFDKVNKKYVGVWIDSMSTGFMHTEGSFDRATKTMTETGSADSPMGKMQMKMVTKHVDDNSFVFTMFMLAPDGNETKSMEITYRRQ
jgi:hypothetical protein